MRLMARETCVRHGAVPDELAGVTVPPGHDRFAGGEYLLRCASGYAYHYRPGAGITIAQPACNRDPDEEELWLNGSVYAAVACINGLYPLHASAVEVQGQVHAFTGPSGAGKSTLVAALAQRGLPLFCDDTLLLDLSDPGALIALPGHKRLKLTVHALALTGLAAEQAVGADTGKSYVAAPHGAAREPLPLASLTILAEGAALGWEPVAGGRRLLAFDDDHYVQRLYAQGRQPSRAELFEQRARIASQIRMARLTRPLVGSSLAETVDLVLARIAPSGT